MSDEIIYQIERIEIDVKYEGYILKQQRRIKRLQQLEKLKLPKDIDYFKIGGLKIEARKQLEKIRPESLGQASRIYGVNPSDIAVLFVWLKKQRVIWIYIYNIYDVRKEEFFIVMVENSV